MSPTPQAAAPLAPVWDETRWQDIEQALLDVPAPLEPLTLDMVDGYLAGVLLQPRRPDPAAWMAHVLDAEARLPPASWRHSQACARLQDLLWERFQELDAAIEARQWFDPWIFDDADEVGAARESQTVTEPGAESSPDAEVAVVPAFGSVQAWVLGFAAAQEPFPELMEMDDALITEPLALMYQHLDPDDLEEADALLAEIESIEPPEDLSDAVECVVRAVLLLADVSRPLAKRRPPIRPAAQGVKSRRLPAGAVSGDRLKRPPPGPSRSKAPPKRRS
jgi:uncharacterized protein